MKRKASTLEEFCPAADWPSFDYSSSASTASPESIKAIADHEQSYARWNIGTVPYINSRTRKRYRDGRPDEETIHQNTLAKLFNAQKQIHSEDQKEFRSQEFPAFSPASQAIFGNTQNMTMWQIPEATPVQPERNQRSIDSFFGGGSKLSTHVKKTQPLGFQFSTAQSASQPLSRCDDCGEALHSTNPMILISDVDDMSIDQDIRHDEWACASCLRRVCDVCAVRGDQRICLECAVPGGG